MRMCKATLLLGIIVYLYGSYTAEAWSGRVCSRRAVRYVTRRYCAYRWWGSCCRWKYYTACVYYTVNYCCPGWRHNNNQACNIPICDPGCYNGGTCINPRKCRCRTGYTGDLCGRELCNWERPCYPGVCAAGSSDCTCSDGFTNKGSQDSNKCLQFTVGQDPNITTSTAQLFVIEPTDYTVRLSIFTDATFDDGNKNEEFWTNLKFFNKLNITFESFHYKREDLPGRPSYIHDAEFGIVQAEAKVLHQKRDLNKWITARDSSHPCTQNGISEDNPEAEVLRCEVDTDRFVTNLEHEDMLKLEVRAKNGGFRDVINGDRPNEIIKQRFTGLWTKKEMRFLFDFRKPYHCKMNNTCTDLPVSIDGKDVRKTGVTIRWGGWTDGLSGIERYIWRIFRLEADRDKNLIEVGEPVYWQQANGTDAGSQTDTYTPDKPGGYSVYLQVSDKANNSAFGRALFIYDPTSQVEINFSPDARLFVASATAQSDFQWQSNLNDSIVVSWENHFRNRFHDENSLLNRVLDFPAVDFVDKVGDFQFLVSRKVPAEYDDNEGERTRDAIPNVNGMVRFEVAYRTDQDLGTSCRPTSPPNQWYNVANPLSETYELSSVTPQEASSLCIWIRGYDVLGNNKTNMTIVSFDSTDPILGEVQMDTNKAPEGMPFHSSIQCRSADGESGVKQLRWRLINNATGFPFDEGVFNTRLQPGELCNPISGDCECISTGTKNCYHRANKFYFRHCGVNVTKTEIASLHLTLEIVAVNSAGSTSTPQTIFINDPTDLDGISEYVAPMNFQASEITPSSVTIEWDNPPGCYQFTAIQVAYRPVNGGQLMNYTVFEQNKNVFLNELYRGTDYVMWIYNIYNQEVSNPSEFKFQTTILTGPEIAGLIIGLLLLIVVVVLLIGMFILWRRGQLRSTIRSRVDRLTQFTRAGTQRLRNRVRRNSNAMRTTIFNNLQKDDDLYVYGNMSFDSKQNWSLDGSDLDLQDIIAEGRFARVYRAVLLVPGSNPQTVAAKMLLPTKCKLDNERLLMKAKINFMVKNGLDHENVIRFAGAIVDDEDRGPIMLLEYCEMGTLRKWLSDQKGQGRVSEDVVDRMFHISFGICKGMEYLASRDIVHRKLAARNILLDFTLQPKIIGFGPVPDELSEDADNTSKGERLPIKWMAPELVKARSTKNATEKSDVWAYAVVVWEIFSLGEAPYSNIKGGDLLKKLNQGYRMKRPEFMTDEYDTLTKKCWNQEPEDRPYFSELMKEQSAWFDNAGNRSTYYDSSQLKNYY